jgi:hypothetical protein
MTTRRAILKAIGLSPAAAVAVIPALEASAAGIGIGVGAVTGLAGNSVGYGQPYPTTGGPKPTKIFNFATWLKRVGDSELREQAREVRTIEPDIAAMRLPLTTKIRWQQERNYRRIVEGKRSWFEKQFDRDGYVEFWG